MRAPFIAAAFALALAMPAAAGHCTTWSTTQPDLDVAGMYYADEDCLDGCGVEIILSLWLYEETNGIAGLQRGDEAVDDTCHGMIPRDTIIF